MAIFRVAKTRDFTVMSNHHLKDKTLSLKAKGLLSMILSLPDTWNYSTRGLAAICMEGADSIGTTLRELENAGYIVRSRLRDEKGRITDIEYTIYENAQAAPSEALPATGEPDTVQPYTENPDTDNPYLENTAQLSTYQLNTQETNTYKENPYQSNPYPDVTENADCDMIGYDNQAQLRNTILENIDYACIADTYNRERLDEIVALMVEALCRKRGNIRIGGEDYPAPVVKNRLLKLDQSHIAYVLDCLSKNTTQIRNIKQYMLAALFNAPVTIGHYYQAAVNYDLYGKTGAG
jgi:hypothetical protein